MDTQQHLDTLTEIRDLMNRSARFLSLSGLGGIWAGIAALIGAAAAAWYLGLELTPTGYHYLTGFRRQGAIDFLLADAALVFVVALVGNYYFCARRAKRSGRKVWDAAAWRLTINLLIPLVSGGIFCAAMLYHGIYGLVAPALLIFYGLAVINASKYTLGDVRYLGLAQIGLGIVASFHVGYGLFYWAMGFGVAHIVYGGLMWYKYERKQD
jgi:general stress protein CsbA